MRYFMRYFFTTMQEGDMKEATHRDAVIKKHHINRLYMMNQVHGDHIVVIDRQSPLIIADCDAMITAMPQVAFDGSGGGLCASAYL